MRTLWVELPASIAELAWGLILVASKARHSQDISELPLDDWLLPQQPPVLPWRRQT